MPLNYLASGAQPGGMPAAVPGASQVSPDMGAIRGRAPIPPALQAAIHSSSGVPGLPTPPGANQGPPQYVTTTQADGSILLHLQNPDGSPGPVMKVIEPIGPRKNPHAPQPGQ